MFAMHVENNIWFRDLTAVLGSAYYSGRDRSCNRCDWRGCWQCTTKIASIKAHSASGGDDEGRHTTVDEIDRAVGEIGDVIINTRRK